MNKRWNYFTDNELRVLLQVLNLDSSLPPDEARIAVWLKSDLTMELRLRHPEAKGETA